MASISWLCSSSWLFNSFTAVAWREASRAICLSLRSTSASLPPSAACSSSRPLIISLSCCWSFGRRLSWCSLISRSASMSPIRSIRSSLAFFSARSLSFNSDRLSTVEPASRYLSSSSAAWFACSSSRAWYSNKRCLAFSCSFWRWDSSTAVDIFSSSKSAMVPLSLARAPSISVTRSARCRRVSISL